MVEGVCGSRRIGYVEAILLLCDYALAAPQLIKRCEVTTAYALHAATKAQGIPIVLNVAQHADGQFLLNA